MPVLHLTLFRRHEVRWRQVAADASTAEQRDVGLIIADGYADLIKIVTQMDKEALTEVAGSLRRSWPVGGQSHS